VIGEAWSPWWWSLHHLPSHSVLSSVSVDDSSDESDSLLDVRADSTSRNSILGKLVLFLVFFHRRLVLFDKLRNVPLDGESVAISFKNLRILLEAHVSSCRSIERNKCEWCKFKPESIFFFEVVLSLVDSHRLDVAKLREMSCEFFLGCHLVEARDV